MPQVKMPTEERFKELDALFGATVKNANIEEEQEHNHFENRVKNNVERIQKHVDYWIDEEYGRYFHAFIERIASLNEKQRKEAIEERQVEVSKDLENMRLNDKEHILKSFVHYIHIPNFLWESGFIEESPLIAKQYIRCDAPLFSSGGYKQNEEKLPYLSLIVEYVALRKFEDYLLNEHISITKDGESLSLQTAIPNNKKKLYFTRPLTDSVKRNLYNELVSRSFIPQDTDYNHFAFAFGGVETSDFEPLRWLKDLQDLKMFVDTFFPGEARKWMKTLACFTDNGVPIGHASIRNLNPSHKKDPPSKEYFEKLKKEIER